MKAGFWPRRAETPARHEQTGRRVLFITFLSACGGAIWAVASHNPHGQPLIGAIGGAANGGLLSCFEGYVLGVWAYRPLVRLPFGLYLAMRLTVYVAVVLFVNVYLASAVLGLGDAPTFENRDIAFAFAMCVALNLLFGVDELLGSGVLFAFVAGRYRRPRREGRVLLCIDMCGSTALAESLGEERFLDLLNEFFADVTAEIVAHGGEVHKYVGDEVIAVWRAGTDPQQPIGACFSARRRLAARAAAYEATFQKAPAFRAAIHAGPVVVGELGARKKEIALIGDAMNTAARILEVARERGAGVLISADYFATLRRALPGIAAERLAPIALRGKLVPLSLISLNEERGGLSSVGAAS